MLPSVRLMLPIFPRLRAIMPLSTWFS